MAAIRITAVIVAAFEPSGGPVPGELTYWRERERMTQEFPFAFGLGSLWLSEDGVLGVVTGVGAVRAASAITALGLDARFDLTRAYWLVTGVCGCDPARGSLGSVVLPEYVVDGDFAHEIDAREIPPEWADGFVPIGKSTPYEEPRADRFDGGDGIVHRLKLAEWAYEAVREIELLDTPGMAERRVQFGVQAGPSVLRGDELASTTFWHGRLMSERARRWVAYQTEGRGEYAITAMEDSGILHALTLLGFMDRVVIVRGVSNFDRQREGISAAESLAETKVVGYSAYLPALENAWRVGSTLVRELVRR